MLKNFFGHYREGQIPIDRNLIVTFPKRPRLGEQKVQTFILNKFWSNAWYNFRELCKDAEDINRQLLLKGESKIANDHVAFRTFNLPQINRWKIGELFEQQGYVRVPEVLHFPTKNLLANYYIHPDENQPKVFVSELILEQVPKPLQQWILESCSHARVETLENLLTPNWKRIQHKKYQQFRHDSEYAVWTAAFGIQVNHFTIFCNRLKRHTDLPQLNSWLGDSGYALNQVGGVIKGEAKRDLLLQSSTQASLVNREFQDGFFDVPACFYEFAERFPIENNEKYLFQGFRVENADKIFHSTDLSLK